MFWWRHPLPTDRTILFFSFSPLHLILNFLYYTLFFSFRFMYKELLTAFLFFFFHHFLSSSFLLLYRLLNLLKRPPFSTPCFPPSFLLFHLYASDLLFYLIVLFLSFSSSWSSSSFSFILSPCNDPFFRCLLLHNLLPTSFFYQVLFLSFSPILSPCKNLLFYLVFFLSFSPFSSNT